VSERKKRGIDIGAMDEEQPQEATSSSAGKVAHRQVRAMTLVAFARCHKARVKLDPNDLQEVGDRVAKLCMEKGVRPTEVQDARFGIIRLYPEWVLREFFRVDD
jgi:hypothetical protein